MRLLHLVAAVLVLVTLTAADGCEGMGRPKDVVKACDTRVVDGPRVHLGLAYAKTTSVCDEPPQSHVVYLALWRKIGNAFTPQQINKGDNTVLWFETCFGEPSPGNNVDCDVATECISGVYMVKVTVIGVGPDGLPIRDNDGDGDWDMPEKPTKELRCPKR